MYVSLFPPHLQKRLSLLHFIVLILLSNIRWLYLHGSISGPSILFHWSSFILSPVPHCVVYLHSKSCLWVVSILFAFILQHWLSYSGVLPFHLNFGANLLISTKYLPGILIGLNLPIKLGRNDILTVLSLHYLGISIHLLALPWWLRG